jgi:hypothetical protein
MPTGYVVKDRESEEPRASVKLEVEPERWDALLEEQGCPDAYYLRGFVESAATAVGGDPVFLHSGGTGGAVVFPCILREVPGADLRDATTFAYGGPLALGPAPPLARFYDLYEEWCAREGILSTFVRFHPLFPNQRFEGGPFRLEQVEGSVSWRLEGELFAKMHPHHRRLVRKARAAGVCVETADPSEALARLGGAPRLSRGSAR